MAISYLSGGRLQGLSSDTKPTNVPIQSLFEETDTGKFLTLLYANGFASASWIEMGTGGVITQNTALNSTIATGGNGDSGGTGNYNILTSTETFSGGTWTAGGNMSTNRTIHAGGGTSSNAFVAAGETSSGGGNYNNGVTCEEYNGSAWGAGGDYPYIQYYLSGAGQQTNAIAGGGNGTHSRTTHSHEYNGTAWSAIGASGSATIGYGAYGGCFGGNATDCLSMGGQDSASHNKCEEYNGSSWSAGGDLNTGRYVLGGDGSTTNAIIYQGASTQNCEKYNGSSWTSIGNGGGSGSKGGAFAGGNSTQAVCGFGKISSTRQDACEIWDGSSFSATGTATVTREYPNGGSAN